MLQLRFLSGTLAGHTLKASHFPWRLGRGAQSDCRLEDPGIWDCHAEISLSSEAVIRIALQSGAKGSLNGQSFESAALRNGDLLDMGAVKIQLWLSEPVPRDWRWRECLVWLFLLTITILQVILIYWLVRV